MNASFSDRRKEPRRDVDGIVYLLAEGSVSGEVEGKLLDVSKSGFRAVHRSQELSSGEVVSFRHQYASGRAKVVWRRILADDTEAVEAGFWVLDSAPKKSKR